MNANDILLLAFGMLAGFALGYVTSWRFARKLEHHSVRLWAWDQHWDAQAQPKVTTFPARESR